jgi:hypothetical protein
VNWGALRRLLCALTAGRKISGLLLSEIRSRITKLRAANYSGINARHGILII